MKFQYSLVYTALFAGVSVSAAAQSETAPKTADTVAELEQITVTADYLNPQSEISYQSKISNIANKGATPLIDSPQTVNVVNQRLLQDRKPTSIDEALATVSGVSQANTLGGIFDAVLKRGFGGNRDNSILRNGVIAGPSHNFSATTERLEVLKGPASVLYGIQDPGGVINVVTKKPQYTPKYVIGVSGGSNSAWGTQLDFSGGLDYGFAYRFIYDQSAKDYWRDFGKIKRALYAPSLMWKNDRTEVVLAYEHQDYVDPFDRGNYIIANGSDRGQFINIPTKRRLDEPFNENSGKIDTLSLQLKHQLSDAWTLNATYGYTRDTYNYWQARVNIINLTNRTALRQLEGIRGADQRTHSAAVNLVGEFATGDIAHRLVAGVDVAQTKLDIARYQGGTHRLNIDNPIYGQATLANMPLANANGHQFEKLKTLGVYVQDSTYLTDDLILSAGIRYEYYDQEAGRGGLTVPDRLNTDSHDGKVVYQGGLVYKLTPNWAVYGNYAQSFRPQLSRAAVTDSALKPEEGQSYEIGTKYENAFLSSNLSLFHIDKKNVAYTERSGDISVLRLKGKVRSQGVEWDINGSLTDDLGITASYAYTKTETREDDNAALVGQPLQAVPKHQARLFLTYDLGEFLGGNWRLGGGARYQGSWFVFNTHARLSHMERYKIPHAVVYDAFLAYDTQIGNQKLSLQLNGKNLSDKTYYVSTQGLNNNVIPVALGYEREFLLSAKLEF